MDDPFWPRLLILGGLLILSAFFSGSETAFMVLDRQRLRYLVEKKRRGADRLEALVTHPDRLLGGILIGNNLVNIAASVFATGLFVHWYGERGELLTILVLTPILLVFSEVFPKTFAAKNAETFSFLMIRPILAVLWLLTPVIWVITSITRLMSRLIRGEGEVQAILSEDEIRSIITAGEQSGVVAKEKRRMLHGIFELARTRVRDVMIPRPEVVGIEVSATFDEVLRQVRQAHHSRFPVYEGNLDSVVGIIHSKDILNYVGRPEEFSLRDAVRLPFFVPESTRIEALLQSMRKERIHLALVVDEYGGVEGVVTMEDIVEEIVGDIQDEYDVEEVLVRELGPGRFLIDGSTLLRSLNRRFGLKLSEEHTNTLAGFLMRTLGAIPEEGDRCEADGTVFIVRKVVERRVEEVEMMLPERSSQS